MHKQDIVNLNEVWVTLRNRIVLEGISFCIHAGSFTGIIGPNGAGKTTLLKLILGLLQPTQGQVQVFGQNPVNMNRKKYRVGYLPQSTRFNRNFPVSVTDVVLMGAVGAMGFFHLPNQRYKKQALEIMDQVGILELKNRPMGELSGGQQQLTFLASSLIARPELLILDEPTTGLDPLAQDNFYQLLQTIQRRETITILAVSHDQEAISANAESLLYINKTILFHSASSEMKQQMQGIDSNSGGHKT